jgi:hypothetical protein
MKSGITELSLPLSRVREASCAGHQNPSRWSKALLLGCTLAIISCPLLAQTNATLHFQEEGERQEVSFDRKTLALEQDFSLRGFGNYNGAFRGTFRMDVSDIDFDQSSVADNGYRVTIDLNCKQGQLCVPYDGTNGNGPVSDRRSDLTIFCNSKEECVAFFNALRDSVYSASRPAAPKPDNLGNTTTQPRSVPGPVPQPVTQTRTPSVTTSTSATGTALQDILANIGWLSNNGGNGPGNTALGNLANRIRSGQRPAPTPVARPSYAAFSQAGGFDANGAWGVGTGTDLNSAVGTASGNCSQRAQTGCDDEGYCMLRPGLWGAWASDLKVAGNSAFTCNVATDEAARAQAQAWCGAECKVLWSGAAQ